MILISGIFKSVYLLPRSMQMVVAHAIAVLWYDVLRIRRKVVHQNIKLCFPEFSEKQVRQIARQSFINQGITVVDFANMLFMNPSDVLKNCTFENWHILDKALSEKKGVMLLGSHLSNGDYGIAALSQNGAPINLVSKNFTNMTLDRFMYKARHRFGTKTIAARRSSFEILKALKKNEIVIFVLDQFMGPPIGVPTTFFGHPTGTAMALALFAEKTKAPVVPCYTYRKEDGSYCVRFEKPVAYVPAETPELALKINSQNYNDQLESVARRYPNQWLWLHRRWKIFQ